MGRSTKVAGSVPRGRITVRAFGPLLVRCGEETLGPRDLGGTKPRQILQILISARGHPVPKDRLADLVWGDDPPRDAIAVLQSHISVLRRHLDLCGNRGRDVVVSIPGGYRLATEDLDLDLDRFDELVKAAEGTAGGEARQHLEDALALADLGPVFEDETLAAWAERMRRRFDELMDRARLDAATAALAQHDFARALGHAGRVVEKDPANERACRIVMTASYSEGEQEPALRAFLETRDALSERFGVEPLPETQALYLAILRHEPPQRLLSGDRPRTESGFRRLVEQQTAIVWWTTDLDLRVSSVAGDSWSLVGLARDELLGKTIAELFPDPDSPVLSAHRSALSGVPRTSDVARDDRTLMVHVEPLRHAGEVIGVVGVAVDVTSRKRVEAVLQETEQRLEAQYQGVPIPTYTWQRAGDDFVLIGFNEAAERSSKGLVEGFLGKKASHVYAGERHIFQDMIRCVTEETTVQREMPYSVPQLDREVHLRVTYVFAPPDQVIVHTEDLTERRQAELALHASEEGLRSVVEGSTEAIFIIDPFVDEILEVNARGAEMLDYTREELLARRPSDLHPEEMVPLLEFMRAVAAGGPGWSDEFTCTTKGGRLMNVEICATTTSFGGRTAIVNQIRPIAAGRETDPGLLAELSGR